MQDDLSHSLTDREKKIILFLKEDMRRARWCEAQYCACIGCINKDGFNIRFWKEQHPNESLITKEEHIRLRDFI